VPAQPPTDHQQVLGAPTLPGQVCDSSSDHATDAALARARELRPSEAHYPQLVQADDYATVQSVEFLYAALRPLARDPSHWALSEPPDPLFFHVQGDTIVVSGATRSLSIKVDDQQASFAGRTFREPATLALFRTFHAVLLELAENWPPVGVLGTQVATRAYRKFTRLHFSFGPLVVELESAQNGGANPERLYVLDLTRQGQSLLWAHVVDGEPAAP